VIRNSPSAPVARLQAALAPEPDRISIELALAAIELGVEQAVPCGLILNELPTNAFKYAFVGRTYRRIAVSFQESATGMRELSVEDDGIGMPVDQRNEPKNEPNETSLGLRIIGVLARQLDGTLSREPGTGTRIVLRFQVGPPRVGDNKAQCAH
jgi:two-component sensor histidine kinase